MYHVRDEGFIFLLDFIELVLYSISSFVMLIRCAINWQNRNVVGGIVQVTGTDHEEMDIEIYLFVLIYKKNMWVTKRHLQRNW